MNFDFSDDQKLLKEQVRKFLADKCPTKTVRRVLDGNETHADEVWKGLIELGVTATAIPEEYGGLGLSPLELCVVAEEIGTSDVIQSLHAVRDQIVVGFLQRGLTVTYVSSEEFIQALR